MSMLLIESAKSYNFSSGFGLTEIQDLKLSDKRYYRCDDLASNKSFQIFLKNNKGSFQIAQRGFDIILLFNDETQVIFTNSSFSEIMPLIDIDSSQYTHQLTIKTAEFHTNLEIRDLNSSEVLAFGAAPKISGALYGDLNIRNESYYSEKYFLGNRFLPHNYKNPHFNKASISISFPITNSDVQNIKSYVAFKANEIKEKSLKYNFLGINGINCADFANEILNHIKIPGKIIDYYKIDELDHRDQGIQYLLWSDIGSLKYVKEMPYDVLDFLSYTIFKKSFSHALENFLSNAGFYNYFSHPHSPLIPAAYKGNIDKISEYLNLINTPNHSGDTPLHIALEYGNVEFASMCLSKAAEVDSQNDRGLTPLHFAAGLSPSVNKNKILEELAERTFDINDSDTLSCSTPLTKAVEKNDYDAVKILLEHGANASFINCNKDNLANIAIRKNSFDVLNILYKNAPEIIKHDNLEHQIPICEIAKQKNPISIITDFDNIWSEFDQSLCKESSQLEAILYI